MGETAFVRRTIIVIALAAFALLLWQLRTVLLMVFGAVVAATLFRVLAHPFRSRLGLPQPVAVLCGALVLFGIIAFAGWLIGNQLLAQAQELGRRIPSAWNSVLDRVEALGIDASTLSWESLSSNRAPGSLLSSIAGIAASVSNAAADLLVMIFGGLFIAAKPAFYGSGAIKLFPAERRALVAEAGRESDGALRLWLKAQLASMVLVGVLTGAGLWLAGVPSAAILGLIAGILEFIPFAGPFLSAAPGMVLALAEGPSTALWALVVYIVVQNGEAYIISPLVQQWAVTIPPAVLLFSLLAAAALFGPLGIIFAAPLTIVVYVLVKRLYVVEALDTETPIPGDD